MDGPIMVCPPLKAGAPLWIPQPDIRRFRADPHYFPPKVQPMENSMRLVQ